jgi:hypothetical protein
MPDEAAAGLDALRETLLECAQQYLSDDLSSQRRAVQNALFVVAKFLQESDFPPVALLPIIRPALALFEREERNAIDLMFSERPRGGRPRATTDDHLRTAILAALANAWLQIHEGVDRPQKDKLVDAARNMRGPWFEGVTAATLKTSREVVAREAKHHEVVEHFEQFSRIIDGVAEAIGSSRSFSFMVRYINEHPVSRVMGILKTPHVSTLKED